MTGARKGLWITRAVLALLWLAVTAGIAFYVARNAEADDDPGITDPLPEIDLANQTTVTLGEHIIAPVISGDGLVIQAEGAYLSKPRSRATTWPTACWTRHSGSRR